MSFGYSPEGLHLVTTVPLEPYYTAGGEITAAELNYHRHGNCTCWELLALVSTLKYRYSEVVDRLCTYHREYYTKRTAEPALHLCDCQKPDRPTRFCWACGYCHTCGTDLCTTSTPTFHRCSCLICLNRCCGIFGVEAAHILEARQRHQNNRKRQERSRCPRSATPAPREIVGASTQRALPPLRVPVTDLRNFLQRRAEALIQRSTNPPQLTAASSSALPSGVPALSAPIVNPRGIGRGYTTVAGRPNTGQVTVGGPFPNTGQVTIGGPFKRPRSPVRAPSTPSTTPAPSAPASTAASAPECIGSPNCPRSTVEEVEEVETIDLTEDDW